jgi:2-polyprenyl-3-methyl-5-hydroxy-6-metoxy-1,4-benzoquinol methylase
MERFDAFSKQYKKTLNRSVSFSGGNSDYFAEYKARYIWKSVCRENFSGKVLDFGCGVGLLSSFLRKYLQGATIHGYDTSKESIAMVSDELLFQGVFTPDSARLDNDYDLIIISNVMHHIEPKHRQETIVESFKRLSVGGKLAVFEHNPANPLTRLAVSRCPFDEDATLLSPKEVLTYLLRAGFRLVRRDYIVFFPPPLSWCRSLEPLIYWCPIGAQYALVGEKT